MKKILFILFATVLFCSCDKYTYKEGTPSPKINVIEQIIPTDMTQRASVEFQVTGGVPPYKFFEEDWKGGEFETIDESTYHYRIKNLPPTATTRYIYVIDSNFGGDYISIDFIKSK